MKNLSNIVTRSKVLVLALAFALPVMAHAGDFKGKFTLTSETHWGSAVLAPGDYDFVLDSISAPTKVVVRAANGKVAAMLVSMWSSETYQGKTNSLKLETHGAELFVSAVELADMDTELHFPVPSVKPGVMAHEASKAPSATMTASVQ